MAAERDFYEVLGVERDADTAAIRRAFRARARELHPDVSRDDDAERRFAELTHAYRVLSRPSSRVLYDRLGYAAPGRGAETPTGDEGREVFDLGVVVVLPIEAERGTTRRIGVAATGPCPRCDGTGTAKDEEDCWNCDGEGSVYTDDDELVTCPVCEGDGRGGPTDLPGPAGAPAKSRPTGSVNVPVPAGSEEGAVLTVQVDEMTEGRLVLRVQPERDLRIVRYAAAAALLLAVFLFVVLAVVPARCSEPSEDARSISFATSRRSATKSRMPVTRASSSGARRIEEGCTVATTCGPVRVDRTCRAPSSPETAARGGSGRPWRRARRPPSASRPRSRLRATAGTRSSRSQFGFWWMRRLPRGSHLKCLTAFVTYARARSIPASASALSKTRPAGPTNGRPSRSSSLPGCSPTNRTSASLAPLAEDGLRAELPEVAGPAPGRSSAKLLE